MATKGSTNSNIVFTMHREVDIGSMTENERIDARRYHVKEARKYIDQDCAERGSRGGLTTTRNARTNKSERFRLSDDVVPTLKGEILCLKNENSIMTNDNSLLTEENASLLEYMHEMRLEIMRLRNSNSNDLRADTCVCCGECKLCHYENSSDTDDTGDGEDVIDGEAKSE